MKGKTYTFKSFKIGFNSIVKSIAIKKSKLQVSYLQEEINNKVLEINQIVHNTYLFIKAYILYLHANEEELPVINEKFISLCLKLFYTPKKKGNLSKENQQSFSVLKSFYNNHFDEHNKIQIIHNCEYIDNFLNYEAIDILKNFENMLKFTFIDKVRKHVDYTFELKKRDYDREDEEKTYNPLIDEKIEENELLNKRTLRTRLEKVKRDIFENTNTAREEYSDFINDTRNLICGDRVILNNVYYDLKVNPWNYFSSAIELDLNIFPLRRSFIPKYITLDNFSLQKITCCYGKEEFSETWNRCFKLSSHEQVLKYQKRGYELSMIKTDGKGVSVLLQKEVSFGFKDEKSKELYINDDDFLVERDYKSVVGIDPGKEDIIHCSDGINKFRYSAVQRKRETCRTLFKKKINRIRKPLETIELELSKCNSKTSNYGDFLNYITTQRNHENESKEIYENELFRTQRWKGYMLKQKSESKMISNFKKIFGNSDEVVIGIGDWEQRKNMRYKEPTLGIGVRKIFRRSGYSVYLVDEFRTSCTCFSCDGENKKFLYRESQRPQKEEKKKNCISLVHGLLKCKTCNRFWNRDTNAALNIHRLTVSTTRPESLSRKKKKPPHNTSSLENKEPMSVNTLDFNKKSNVLRKQTTKLIFVE